MKTFLCIVTLTLTAAGCAGGVPTGRKSPCAGTFQKDGIYTIAPASAARGAVVSRSSVSLDRMSFTAGGEDDCQFTSL
jgi:hypothetical protein